jgi:DNA-binding SARP family transcriptional activator
VLTRRIYVRSWNGGDGYAPIPRLHLRLSDRLQVLHCVEGAVRLAPLCERLVAFLAVRGPTPRQYLAFRLWPDQSEDQSLSCLRTALWRLPRPGDDPLVWADGSTLRLADHVEVDIHLRYAEVEAWTDSVGPPASLMVESFTADILEGWYDDWAVMERERYRQMRLHMLERLSAWATQCGHFADAISAGLRAVEGGPLRESAHRCLVAAHLAEGNVDEAVRQVRVYFAELDRADLPRRLTPAMKDLLPHHALPLLLPPAHC